MFLNRLFEMLMSKVMFCIVPPSTPTYTMDGKPVQVGDSVSVKGKVTAVYPSGHNYGSASNPTVQVTTAGGYTPEVPARNVYSDANPGTSTVVNRSGKPIQVGDNATIVGTASSVSNGQVSLDLDNNAQAVAGTDLYATQSL